MRVARQLMLALLLILVAVMIGPKAKAAQVSSVHTLTLSPAFVNEVLQPGSTTNGATSLFNQGGTYGYGVYPAPYGVVGEDYNPSFMPLPDSVNVASWFRTNPTNGYLNTHSSLLVRYTITVPTNTQPGGYYGALFVQAQSSAVSPTKSIIQINQRLGELFYLQVAGPVRQSGKLASWRAAYLQTSLVVATLRLENDGGVHYFSNIKVSFRDILGHAKFSVVAQKAVLPRTIRRVPLSWPHPPSIGLFKINGSATIYGKAVELPSRYVLVVSPTARLVVICAIGSLLVVAVLIGSIMHTVRQRRKATYKKNHHA